MTEVAERKAASAGGAGGLLRRRRAPRGTLESQQRRLGYGLVAPVVIVLLAITAYPLIYNVWNSFHNVSYLNPPGRQLRRRLQLQEVVHRQPLPPLAGAHPCVHGGVGGD